MRYGQRDEWEFKQAGKLGEAPTRQIYDNLRSKMTVINSSRLNKKYPQLHNDSQVREKGKRGRSGSGGGKKAIKCKRNGNIRKPTF